MYLCRLRLEALSAVTAKTTPSDLVGSVHLAKIVSGIVLLKWALVSEV